uniref:Uncharacterized protein n=1 Tax=Aegilops tauschii subsp. strangulata TaxID=200361 RepID=A0A453GFX5_AEGTS
AIPLNKQLYTLSYICVTAGAAGIVFSMLYFLVDVVSLRYVFEPLRWVGMNAMLVYVMAAAGIFEGFLNGWYYDGPKNTLVTEKNLPASTAFGLQHTLRNSVATAGLLGEEARVRQGVALGEGGHPPLRPRRADPALGAPCRPPPPGRGLLEALVSQEDIGVIICLCVLELRIV